MIDTPLRADCTRCAALCCIGPAFDRSDMFAIDKPASVACPNLDAEHLCTIHENLEQRGFAGCVRFDCLGAGQRVTQELFAGRSWRDDPALVQPMTESLRIMHQVHELLQLLQTAARLPLNNRQNLQRVDLLEKLQPKAGWSLDALLEFERGDLTAQIEAFLGLLREYVSDDRKSN